MEVYIEVILLQQWMIHGLSFLSALIFINRALNKQKGIVYLLLISFISFNIYLNFPNTYLYIYLFLIHLLLFKGESLLFYFSYLLIYHVYLFVLLRLQVYSTYQYGLLIIYRWTNLFPTLFFLLVIVLSYELHAYFLKRKYVFNQLCYPVSFYYQQKHYQLSGYLDTGNLAHYKGIPIIFIKENILDLKETEQVMIHSINASKIMRGCIVHHIQIQQTVYKEMYVVESKDLDIKEDCLLNVALLYER